MSYSLKGFPAVVVITIGAVVMALAALVGAGVAVGAANAWLLEGSFSTGWHAVWAKPLVAVGWTMLFGPAGGALASRKKKSQRASTRRIYA